MTLGTLPDPQTLISSPVAGDNDKYHMAVVMTPELFFYGGALGGKCHLWLSHYSFEKYVTFFGYHEEHCSLIICVTNKS